MFKYLTIVLFSIGFINVQLTKTMDPIELAETETEYYSTPNPLLSTSKMKLQLLQAQAQQDPSNRKLNREIAEVKSIMVKLILQQPAK